MSEQRILAGDINEKHTNNKNSPLVKIMSHRNPSDLGRVSNTLFYYIIFTLSTDHVRAPENIQVQIYLTELLSFHSFSSNIVRIFDLW